MPTHPPRSRDGQLTTSIDLFDSTCEYTYTGTRIYLLFALWTMSSQTQLGIQCIVSFWPFSAIDFCELKIQNELRIFEVAVHVTVLYAVQWRSYQLYSAPGLFPKWKSAALFQTTKYLLNRQQSLPASCDSLKRDSIAARETYVNSWVSACERCIPNTKHVDYSSESSTASNTRPLNRGSLHCV